MIKWPAEGPLHGASGAERNKELTRPFVGPTDARFGVQLVQIPIIALRYETQNTLNIVDVLVIS